MTPDELRAQFPEIFEVAEYFRAKDPTPGAVRLRCIRVGVDENGEGGTVVAGKVPPPDPNTFEVSAESLEALRQHNEFHGFTPGRRPRGRGRR